MSARITHRNARPRIVIAGGGVAALEGCLALRSGLSVEDLDIDLVAPEQRFLYRPLSVLESFGGALAWSMPLARFAGDHDALLVHDALARVDADDRAIVTRSGVRCAYDLLLVAVGATASPQIPGAITFNGSSDSPAVQRMLDDASTRLRPRVTFAVGAGTSWPLPLYELALLTARALRARQSRPAITLVTHEAMPLELFGARASEVVRRALDRVGVSVRCGVEPLSFTDGRLRLADGAALETDRVVALPQATGRPIDGLPRNEDGFIPVDEHGRVDGLDGIYAAGDITDFPFKQGGLATQQADAAAEMMLHNLGLPIAPRPFSPVLHGVLFTGDDPADLQTPLGAGQHHSSEPRGHTMWWPPSKIAGRFLSSYLSLRAGAPPAPEARLTSDVTAVLVDLRDVAHRIHDADPARRVSSPPATGLASPT